MDTSSIRWDWDSSRNCFPECSELKFIETKEKQMNNFVRDEFGFRRVKLKWLTWLNCKHFSFVRRSNEVFLLFFFNFDLKCFLCKMVRLNCLDEVFFSFSFAYRRWLFIDWNSINSMCSFLWSMKIEDEEKEKDRTMCSFIYSMINWTNRNSLRSTRNNKCTVRICWSKLRFRRSIIR